MAEIHSPFILNKYAPHAFMYIVVVLICNCIYIEFS